MYLYNHNAPEATEALYSLACGPHICAKKYTGCIINGVRFHIRDRDNRLRSQNSGVVVEGNHKDESIDFYGFLTNIIEIDYVRGRRVVIFQCKWFDLGDRRRGIRVDGNITSVNVSSFWYENDPFVLACQAKQVFYLTDTTFGNNWQVVQQFQHRHIFYVQEIEDEVMDENDLQDANNEVYQDIESNSIDMIIDLGDHETEPLHRVDVEPVVVERNQVQQLRDEQLADFVVDEELSEEDVCVAEYCTDEDDIQYYDCDDEFYDDEL